MATLIEIAQSRPDVLNTAKSQGGDPFTAGTGANTWLNNWWNTAGKNEFPGVTLGQPTPPPQNLGTMTGEQYIAAGYQGGQPITPDSLTSANQINLNGAPQQNIDESALAVASAEAQAEQDAKVAEEKAKKEAAESDITGILTQLEEEPAEQLAAEQEAGIPGFAAEQADVQGQIGIKTAEYRQLEAQEEAFMTAREGIPGFTMSEVSGQQAQIQREFRSRKNMVASDIGLLQARSLAISGKQVAAQAAVDRAIDLKYDSLRLQLDTKKFLFDAIREDLSDAEAEQLRIQEDILARQEADLAEKKQTDKDIQNIMLSVVGVAPADVLSQISQATTVLEASQIASPYLAEVDTTDTQVVTANGRSLLINKQTGETIRDLGYAYKEEIPEKELTDMEYDFQEGARLVISAEGISPEVSGEQYGKLLDSMLEEYPTLTRSSADKMLMDAINKLKGQQPQTVQQVEENIGSDFITETPTVGAGLTVTPQQQQQQAGQQAQQVQLTQSQKDARERARQKAIKLGLVYYTDPITKERLLTSQK